jgi:hypothetical protein
MPVDQKHPLRVSVQGVTEKMRNTLQYYFHGPCNDGYELVDEALSELSIIDLDGLDGQQNLDNHRNNNPDKPLILLTVNDEEIDGAILVHKPLKTENLASALETVRQKIRSNINLPDGPIEKIPVDCAPTEKGIRKLIEKVPIPDNKPVDKTKEQNNSQLEKILKQNVSTEVKIEKLLVTQTSSRSETNQAAKFLDVRDDHSYIGSAPDIALNDSKQLEKAQYNPEIYFQGYIGQAVSKAGTTGQAVLLTIPDGWIVIRPDTQAVFINIQESKLRAFSALPITDETITKSLLEKSNLSDYSQRATSTSLEQLLWKSAIWSSRGRIPIGTNLTLPISLKHWPNLSRLLLSPHALRIAALWSEYPCSLLDTAKTLQIPQRYVFAFYSACHAIGVASVQQGSSEVITKAMPEKKNNKRAFLGRLLERLKSYTR